MNPDRLRLDPLERRALVRPGTCYLVGGGPGDPALLTRRAAEVVAAADLVCVSTGVSDALSDALTDEVTGALRHEEEVGLRARSIAEALAGRSVAVVVPGDPLLVGGGASLLAAWREAGVPFEVVPGVASPVAAGAFAGAPLLAAGDAGALLAVKLAEAAAPRAPSGAASFEVVSAFAEVADGDAVGGMARTLASATGLGAEAPALAVTDAGTPRQHAVFGTVASLGSVAMGPGEGGPASVVIGAAAAFGERLAWYDRRPLFGKRVLVTRPRHQAPATCRLLRSRGAEPLQFPAIAIEPNLGDPALAGALDELRGGAYGLVAFTSDNGVRCFFDALDAAGLDARVFGRATVAAIGPATANALRLRGVRPDVVAPTFVAESLAESILARPIRPARALLPRAAVAREVLPESLAAAGIAVDVVPVYRTTAGSAGRAEALRKRLGDLDVVLFTSSSTVEHLVALLGSEAPRLLDGILLASIGPVTTRTAEALGLAVAVTAEESTTAGLVDALERHLARPAPPGA